ncbi:MAG: MmcQ/YjbR family DNA-binding protein, partial [Acidobacteriota bacterium]
TPLSRLRSIIEAWPETREKISHGSPTWWGGRRTFARFADHHHGDGRVAVWVKSTFEEQAARVEVNPEIYFVPPYMGPSGWVGCRLDRDLDWAEVEELLLAGYRLVAPERARRQLDEAEP